MYKRILLKISGEALMGENGPIGFEKVEKTAKSIAALADKGIEVGVVVGGGNIIRGRDAGQHDRNRRDHMGMLATAINALALQDAFEGLGKKAAVLSAVDMDRFCDSFSSRKAKELLSQKVIVIFACGSGCPFFSTDTAAALRAAEIGADALLLAKNVDAVYDSDPATNPDAKKFDEMTHMDVIEKDLKVMDLTAATLCKDTGTKIYVFALAQEGNLMKVINGENVGTLIQ